MSEYSIFTSESVSEGHPDKMADQISDAILDAIIKDDPHARGAVETLVKTGMAVVAAQSGYWEMDRANGVAAALLLAHPELTALLCANDSMALGAAAAVRAAGRSEDVAIVGFDNISAVQELVRNGSVLATVDQHADQIAVNGIEHALAILDGGETPAELQTEVTLIPADTMPCPTAGHCSSPRGLRSATTCQ